MSFAPKTPYQPYAEVHSSPQGPGDARPTALQIVKDANAQGKLKGKTILITGCSAGLGVETARALYETGATLYLAARNMKKLDEVIEDIVSKASSKDTPRPQTLSIHLDSLESVRAAAEDFKKRSNQLNMIINNAGVMACPYETTKDGFELQIGTNHFAHFLLFQLLKPLLLKSAAESGISSRVINVSSAGHRLHGIRFEDTSFDSGKAYHKWQAYGQSKTANVYMASSIERHYASKNLHGLSLHPGGIQTDLARHLSQEDYEAMGLNDPAMRQNFKSPEQGAATTVWAALSDHFEGKNGGRYLAECGEAGPTDPESKAAMAGYAPHVYDAEAEEKLWKLSYQAVGLPVED